MSSLARHSARCLQGIIGPDRGSGRRLQSIHRIASGKKGLSRGDPGELRPYWSQQLRINNISGNMGGVLCVLVEKFVNLPGQQSDFRNSSETYTRLQHQSTSD